MQSLPQKQQEQIERLQKEIGAKMEGFASDLKKKKFYLEDMKLSEDTTEKLLIREFQCANAGLYMSRFMDVFTSPDQLDNFIQLYNDAHVHTCMYAMKGHTPLEMRELLKDGGEPELIKLQNTKFHLTFDPSEVRPGGFSIIEIT